MAPRGVGKTRGAYLFAMAIRWEGLRCGVEALEDDTIVEDELGLVSGKLAMLGWQGSEGMNGGGEWTSKVEGNNVELRVVDNCS